MYRRLGGPQGRSGQVRKISPPPGFDPPTVQPLASRYTDCAIPAHTKTPYTFLFSPCMLHAQPTLPLSISSLIISAEECKLRRSTLRNFLSPPVPPPSLLDPKVLLRTRVFKYPQSRLFSERSRPNLISIQNKLPNKVKMLENF